MLFFVCPQYLCYELDIQLSDIHFGHLMHVHAASLSEQLFPLPYESTVGPVIKHYIRFSLAHERSNSGARHWCEAGSIG